MKTIRVGGPFSIACPKCRALRQDPCRARNGRKRSLHTKRRDAARTCETTVQEGDLVIVVLSSGRDRNREALAHLKTIGDETAIVRVWRSGPQAFATPRLVALRDIVRPAPETAAEKLAKEQLEVEARAAASPSASPPGHSPSEAPRPTMTPTADPWSTLKGAETTARKAW